MKQRARSGHFFCSALLSLFLLAGVCVAGEPPAGGGSAPAVDKAALEQYLRYAEGFMPEVKMTIDDPTPSPYPGFWRLSVHLHATHNALDKVYYLTADGKSLVSGSIWDLKQNPFIENVRELDESGPTFGPADAKITLIVFSDFECPYCREFAHTLRDTLPQKYPKEVRVIFKDFPIDSLHPWARAAAEAGHCLANQKPDAFWAYHDWIFQHQGEVSQENLREKTLAIAGEQKLDTQKVASCIDSHATKDVVERNEKLGRMLQIQQTPTFFVNGRMLAGALPWSSLDSVLQLELKRPAQVPPISAADAAGTRGR
jgi:protein-disulfide isomerase